jgi:replicative DNA helicase
MDSGGTSRRTASSEPPPDAEEPSLHDLDAEAAVLRAALLDADNFFEVAGFLQIKHFHSRAHQLIFEAVLALRQTGGSPDAKSVADWLLVRELLEQVGDTAYLARLTDAGAVDPVHVAAQGRVVEERWHLRRAREVSRYLAGDAADETARALFDLSRQPQAIAPSLKEARVPTAWKGAALHEAFLSLGEAATHSQGVTGIATGFADFDRATHGLHVGDLYIVTGRRRVGKTAFLLNVAARVAEKRTEEVEGSSEPELKSGMGVLFFSPRMRREQLALFLLARDARVETSRIRRGEIFREHWINMTESAQKLGTMPLWLDDALAPNLLDVRARVRRLQSQLVAPGEEAPGATLGLVVLDDLEWLSWRGGMPRRARRISELCRGLKLLAKEMGVAVMASSIPSQRTVWQDADAILSIHRDGSQPNVAELTITKRREGLAEKVELYFDEACTRFDSLDSGDYDFDEEEGETTNSPMNGER